VHMLVKKIILISTVIMLCGCWHTASMFIGTWDYQSGQNIITCTVEDFIFSYSEDITDLEFEIVESTGPNLIVMLPLDEDDCRIDLSITDNVAVSVPAQSCDIEPDETFFDFAHIDVLFTLDGTSSKGSAAYMLSVPMNDPPFSTGNCTLSVIGKVQKRAAF
jgi:hypothetical protein